MRFEARGGFGEDTIKFFKPAARANRTAFERLIQSWEYNSRPSSFASKSSSFTPAC